MYIREEASRTSVYSIVVGVQTSKMVFHIMTVIVQNEGRVIKDWLKYAPSSFVCWRMVRIGESVFNM